MEGIPPLEPGSDRVTLGFASEVMSAFEFLLGIGFEVACEKVTKVEFSGRALTVTIYHGRSSYEVGCELYGMDGAGYDAAEFMALSSPSSFAAYTKYVALTLEGIRAALGQLSELFHEFVLPHITNSSISSATWNALADYRRRWRHSYAEEVRVSQLKEQAHAAFAARDYPRAALLYGGMVEHLTKVERLKLAFARKRGVRKNA